MDVSHLHVWTAEAQSISTFYQLFLLPTCFGCTDRRLLLRGSVLSGKYKQDCWNNKAEPAVLFVFSLQQQLRKHAIDQTDRAHEKINQHDRLCPLPERVPLHSHLWNSHSVWNMPVIGSHADQVKMQTWALSLVTFVSEESSKMVLSHNICLVLFIV